MERARLHVIFVALEKVTLENDSDKYVLGIGGKLHLHLFLFQNQVEMINPFKVLRAEIFKDLFENLSLDLPFKAVTTYLLLHEYIADR